MALAVEWLPEEWPEGIPNLKQLLVVAPLTTSILLLFRCGNRNPRGLANSRLGYSLVAAALCRRLRLAAHAAHRHLRFLHPGCRYGIERSRPTFSSAFAPANASACAERPLFLPRSRTAAVNQFTGHAIQCMFVHRGRR